MLKLSLAKFPQVFKVYYLNLNKSAKAWQALCTRGLPGTVFHPIRHLLLLLVSRDKAKGFSQLLSPQSEAGMACQQITISFSLSSEFWKPVVRPPLHTETSPAVRLMPLWWAVCNLPSVSFPHNSGWLQSWDSVCQLIPICEATHQKKKCAGGRRCLSWVGEKRKVFSNSSRWERGRSPRELRLLRRLSSRKDRWLRHLSLSALYFLINLCKYWL